MKMKVDSFLRDPSDPEPCHFCPYVALELSKFVERCTFKLIICTRKYVKVQEINQK